MAIPTPPSASAVYEWEYLLPLGSGSYADDPSA